MVEVSQYNFSFAELAEALIKRQSLHEGKWLIGVELTVNVGIMGTAPETSRPGAMLLANQVQLVRAIPGQHPPHLIVDAAVVNPAKQTKADKPVKRAK
jgi:hypothetical protein